MTNDALVYTASVFDREIIFAAGYSPKAVDTRRNPAGVLRILPSPVPEDAFTGGLSALVERFSTRAEKAGIREITVILDAHAIAELGLPARSPKTEDGQKNNPVMAACRDAGWSSTDLRPWIQFWRKGRASVHFGIGPWLTYGTKGKKMETIPFPLDDPQRLADLLARFHKLTGVNYHGAHAGVPGTALIRDHWHRARGVAIPRFTPDWQLCSPAKGNTETSFRTYVFNDRPEKYVKKFDAVRQYLAAARNTLISPDALRRTGPVPWERRRSGYWLITAPTWNLDGLPHPANYETGAKCWVTGPTMELLYELAEQGFTHEPDIHESWTTDGAGEYLRPWADRIETAYSDLRSDESHDGELLREAVKGMYKKGIGLMHKSDARVRRPDWHHAIIAKARTNLFRRMWAVFMFDGTLPDAIHADEISYSFAVPNAVPLRKRGARVIEAFPTEGDTLGQFKVNKGGRK